MNILFVDTETSDKLNRNQPLSNFRVQPGIIQLAYIVYSGDLDVGFTEGKRVKEFINPRLSPDKFLVADGARNAHGISDATLETCGSRGDKVLEPFLSVARHADLLVCHNVDFDLSMLCIEMYRYSLIGLPVLTSVKTCCTMKNTVNLCCLPRRGGGLKFPKLFELYQMLFGEDFDGAHDALNDVSATVRCFFELVSRKTKGFEL